MFTKAFWTATAERMVRGAAVAVSGGWFFGDGLFDAFKVNTWQDVASLAIGGAFSSLVLALAGSQMNGSGPSFGSERLPRG